MASLCARLLRFPTPRTAARTDARPQRDQLLLKNGAVRCHARKWWVRAEVPAAEIYPWLRECAEQQRGCAMDAQCFPAAKWQMFGRMSILVNTPKTISECLDNLGRLLLAINFGSWHFFTFLYSPGHVGLTSVVAVWGIAGQRNVIALLKKNSLIFQHGF